MTFCRREVLNQCARWCKGNQLGLTHFNVIEVQSIQMKQNIETCSDATGIDVHAFAVLRFEMTPNSQYSAKILTNDFNIDKINTYTIYNHVMDVILERFLSLWWLLNVNR